MEEFNYYDQIKLDGVENFKFEIKEEVDSFDVEKIKKLDKSHKLNIYIKNYKSTDYGSIEKIFKVIKDQGIKATLQFDIGKDVLDMKEVETFSGLEEKIKGFGCDISFVHEYVQYSLPEILSAQKKLNDIIEPLKKSNASDFEKYLVIYDFLTSKVYKEDEENRCFSRDLISVLNSDSIVCVGYSELMKYLCDAVGIKCKPQSVTDRKKKGDVLHKNNLIYIDDAKYNIHGWYYADACWDSALEGVKDKKQYIYSLIPLDDKNNFNKRRVLINSSPEKYYYDKAENYTDNIEIDNEIYFGFEEEFKNAGLENVDKELEQKAQDLLLNDDVRKAAFNKLTQFLKQENIPEDIYTKFEDKKVSQICTLPYLVSKLMLSEYNEKEVLNNIKTLKELAENSENKFMYAQSYFSNIDNVYDWLNSNADNKTFEIGFYGQNNGVIEDLTTLMMFEKLKDHYGKQIQKGKPISLETFKKGLRRAYEIEGVPAEKINKLIENSVEYSFERARIKYNENAVNCFAQGAMMQEQKQQ